MKVKSGKHVRSNHITVKIFLILDTTSFHIPEHPDEYKMILFVLTFYGPADPMGSCRVWSAYLTILSLSRFSPLSG